MATVRDLITGSLRLIGAVATGEVPSASEAEDALLVLNDMLDSWSTERLLVLKEDVQVFPLVPGTQSYTLGPSGTFNAARPLKVQRAAIRIGGIDYPMETVEKDGWWAIPDKAFSATVPRVLWDNGGMPTRTLSVWPVPSEAADLVLYTWNALGNYASIDDELVLAPGFRKALRFNLAVELCAEYGKRAAPEIVENANESKANIKRANEKWPVLGMPAQLDECGGEFGVLFGASSSGGNGGGGDNGACCAQIRQDLAAVAPGLGADMIGSRDDGDYFESATVGGQLQELGGGVAGLALALSEAGVAITTLEGEVDALQAADGAALVAVALEGSALQVTRQDAAVVPPIDMPFRIDDGDSAFADDPASYSQLAAALRAGENGATVRVSFIGDSLLFGYQSSAQNSPIKLLERRLRELWPNTTFQFKDWSLPGWGFFQFNGSSQPDDSYIGLTAGEPGNSAWNAGSYDEHHYAWPTGASTFNADSWKNYVAADTHDLVVIGLGFNDIVGGGLSVNNHYNQCAALIAYIFASLKTSTGGTPSVALATPHTGIGATDIFQRDKVEGANQLTRLFAHTYRLGLLDMGRAFDRRHRGYDPTRYRWGTERWMADIADLVNEWKTESFLSAPSSLPFTGAGSAAITLDTVGKHAGATSTHYVRRRFCGGVEARFTIQRLATDNDYFDLILASHRDPFQPSISSNERMLVRFYNTAGVGKIEVRRDGQLVDAIVNVAAFPTSGNYRITVHYDGTCVRVFTGATGPNSPAASFRFAAYMPGYAGVGYSNAVTAPDVRVTNIQFRFADISPLAGIDTTFEEGFGETPVDAYKTATFHNGGDGGLHLSALGNTLFYDPPIAGMIRAIQQAHGLAPYPFTTVTTTYTLDGVNNRQTFGASHVTALTINLPSPALKKIPVGFETDIINTNVGPVTIAASDGNSLITGPVGATTIRPYQSLKVKLVGGSTTQYFWHLIPGGDFNTGTYTPSFSNVSNVAAIAANGLWRYSRVGNMVTVSGAVDITPTAAAAAPGTLTLANISLPIASAFTTFTDGAGTATAAGAPANGVAATITTNPGTDRLDIAFNSVASTARKTWAVIAQYQLL